MNLKEWIFSEELPGYKVVNTIGQGSFGEVHFSAHKKQAPEEATALQTLRR